MKKYPNLADLAALVGVVLVAQVLAGLLGSVLGTAGLSKGLVTALCYFLSFATAIIFAVYYRQAREGEKYTPRLRFTFKKEWLPALGWGLVMMLAISVVLEPLLELFPKEFYEMVSNAIGRGGWAVLTSVVMAPLLEEMLMRGLVQDATVGRYGPAGGILLSAAVFGVVHLVPVQVVSAFVLGLVLGYIYYKTGSLLAPVLLHAANNLIAYLMMGMKTADGAPVDSLREVIAVQGVYWAIYGVCALMLVVGGVYVWRGLNKKSALPLPGA